MYIKLISAFLIIFSAFMAVRHGWSGLNFKAGDTSPIAELQRTLNLSTTTLKCFSVATILGGLLLLPPQTFLAGNILTICLFVFLIVRFLIAGDIKHALIEIPFLLIPVILIFLKHPLSPNI